MTDSPNSEPDSPKSALDNQMAVLNFLRDEYQANRDAQHNEVDAIRKTINFWFTLAAAVLGVVITVAGVFGLKDIQTFKQSIEQEDHAAAQVEIQKMEAQLHETVQEQFKTDRIQATVHDAAQVAVHDQAPRLISDVITPEVRAAVERQSGTIKVVAVDAAKEEARSAIGPMAAEMKMHGLIDHLNADGDDALALDQLLAMKSSIPESDQRLIQETVDRIAEKNGPFGYGPQIGFASECIDPESPRRLELLHSASKSDRSRAMDACAEWFNTAAYLYEFPGQKLSRFQIEEKTYREFMRAAIEDASIKIRVIAGNIVYSAFSQSPGFPPISVADFDYGGLDRWLSENSKNADILLLLGQAGSERVVSDSADIYDELVRVGSKVTKNLGLVVQDDIARMHNAATLPIETQAALQKRGSQVDCDGVVRNLSEDVSNWDRNPKGERGDEVILFQLQYLTYCPKKPAVFSQVVRYAAGSHSLRRRFVATLVIAAWGGPKLDSFNNASVVGWWNLHRGEYQ